MRGKGASLVARYGLRSVALLYLLFLLVLPVGMVVYYAFDHGLGVFWDAISSPDALHALYLTVLITCIAVPLNTVFGIIAALVLVRRRVFLWYLFLAFAVSTLAGYGYAAWTLYRALSEPLKGLKGRAPVEAVTEGSVDAVAKAVFNALGVH